MELEDCERLHANMNDKIVKMEKILFKDQEMHRLSQQKALYFLLGNIFILVAVGIWAGSIRQDVLHNTELITARTGDRFYASDGEVLESRIDSNSKRQDRLEAQYDSINLKLDKLIEYK